MLKDRLNLRNVVVIATCLVATTMFSSCNNIIEIGDDDDRNRVQLLETATFSYMGPYKIEYKAVDKYEYDKQNRLVKIGHYFYEGTKLSDYSSSTFNYNSVGDLVSFVEEDDFEVFTRTFSKKNNIITEYSTYDVYDEPETATIELNPQGLPVVEYGGENKGVAYYEYQNGNLSKIIVYYDDNNTVTTEYSYDDKKSPFYHCKTPSWFLGGLKNNPLSVTETYRENNKTVYTLTSTVTYTYDDAGFPLTSKQRIQQRHYGNYPIEDYDYDTGVTSYTYIVK